MARIPLDQARAGMILEKKIVREDGVLLAQKGAELSDGLIRMLERLNFETVAVEVVSTETPEERAARVGKELAALDARFVRVEHDPVLAGLKVALAQRIQEGD